EFRASGHDIKHLLRCICNSRAYQRTSRPLPGNERDTVLFSHMAVKVLTPEAIYDSLALVVDADRLARPSGPKAPAGKGKGPEVAPGEEFIQCFRTSGDAPEAGEFSHGIPQLLRRLNAAEFNSGSPLAGRVARSGMSAEQGITELYLAALSRRPTAEEVRLL